MIIVRLIHKCDITTHFGQIYPSTVRLTTLSVNLITFCIAHPLQEEMTPGVGCYLWLLCLRSSLSWNIFTVFLRLLWLQHFWRVQCSLLIFHKTFLLLGLPEVTMSLDLGCTFWARILHRRPGVLLLPPCLEALPASALVGDVTFDLPVQVFSGFFTIR